MKRSDENYWGRFNLSPGASTSGGAVNIMFRAVDNTARVSNFQLPAASFGDVDIANVLYADAWRDNHSVEVDLTLDNGKILPLVIRRHN